MFFSGAITGSDVNITESRNEQGINIGTELCREQVEAQGVFKNWEIALLRLYSHQDATGTELLEVAGNSSRTENLKSGLEKLLTSGILEMTIEKTFKALFTHVQELDDAEHRAMFDLPCP